MARIEGPNDGWTRVLAVIVAVAIPAAIDTFLPPHEKFIVYALLMGIMGVGALAVIVGLVWLIFWGRYRQSENDIGASGGKEI